MKKLIKKYIYLMNKYVLIKAVTVLLILMLSLQILKFINRCVKTEETISNEIVYNEEK